MKVVDFFSFLAEVVEARVAVGLGIEEVKLGLGGGGGVLGARQRARG